MKRYLVLCFALTTLAIFADSLTATDDQLKSRKKTAVEIISSDEGFLEEYSDRLNEKEMTYFYNLSFKMAEDLASETIQIKDDNLAYEYIQTRIECKSGLKSQIRGKIESYLRGEYQLTEVKLNPDFSNACSRMLRNLEAIKLQRAMTTI
ncbi:MAG: hypothetical protein PHW04_10745 [Candidatus Wallbacteria bacterium]|nr:hypothetical protein [Candidatus Wallbacteria bacterium]